MYMDTLMNAALFRRTYVHTDRCTYCTESKTVMLATTPRQFPLNNTYIVFTEETQVLD